MFSSFDKKLHCYSLKTKERQIITWAAPRENAGHMCTAKAHIRLHVRTVDQGLQCPLTESLDTTECMESKGQNDTLRLCRMIRFCACCACLKARFRLTQTILMTFPFTSIKHVFVRQKATVVRFFQGWLIQTYSRAAFN